MTFESSSYFPYYRRELQMLLDINLDILGTLAVSIAKVTGTFDSSCRVSRNLHDVAQTIPKGLVHD